MAMATWWVLHRVNTLLPRVPAANQVKAWPRALEDFLVRTAQIPNLVTKWGIVQIVLSHIATLGMALPGENRRKRCLCSGWMWFVGSRHLQTQHDVAREVDGSFWNTKTGSFLNTRTGSNQNTKTGSFLDIQTNKNTGKSHFIQKFIGKMLRPRT